MGWPALILVFAVTWFTVIFAVLPWGNRPDDEAEHSQSMGAPANPRLWFKAGITTLLALAVTVIVYGISASGVISFRQ